MGLTVRSSSILGIAMELAITKGCKATRMLRPSKFPPKTIFREKQGEIVPNAEIQIALKLNAIYGFQRRKGGR